MESLVATLSAKVASQTEVLQRMVVHADLQSSIIDHNEALLIRMMKKLPDQGETSCKEDELRRRGNDDEDDDPNASKESELPSSSPSRLGTQTHVQGESVQAGK